MYLEENLGMTIHSFLRLLHTRIVRHTTYLGIRANKNPLDFWIYQEIIWETKPTVLIEIGTGSGGATLAFFHLMQRVGGNVITMDIDTGHVAKEVKDQQGIIVIEGNAIDLFPKVKQLVLPTEKVMVIEDSSHQYENTLQILKLYSTLQQSGDYFIVEDTHCHHGIKKGPYPGPYEAVETFLGENPGYEADRSREGFLVTANPKGFLRKL